ncbi:MAG: EAL domain-containing protein [Acidimicrobiales bacterium]
MSNRTPRVGGPVETIATGPDDPGYRLLFGTTPKPMWVHDLHSLRFLDVNPAAVASYGYTREEFLAMTVLDIRPLEDADPLLSYLEEVGRRSREEDHVWRHVKKSGEVIMASITSSPVTFAGRPARLVLADDVTQARAVASALREREHQLRNAQELAHVGTWTWDVGADEVVWSEELARILGLRPDQTPRSVEAYVALIHPSDREGARATVEQALVRGGVFDSDYRVVHADGGTLWLRSRGEVIHDETGRAVRVLGACQDVTDQKAAEESLTRLALHDPLTDLANRALFIDRLDNALVRLTREDTTIAVLFIDLDRFKAINDSLGHGAGDEVLVSVATRLRATVRPSDTVARFGGDEFAVLCDGMEDGAEAAVVAHRVLAALAEPIMVGGDRMAATGASIGMALASNADANAEALLRDADAAMYEAKEAGRNRLMIFDNESRRKSTARLQKAEELRQGLDRNEFRVFYQPLIDLHDEEWVGLEALVRWDHPQRGLVAPGDFIGVAEQTGTVVELGEWVLTEACREIAGLPPRPGAAPLALAVNLSARQLSEPSLIDALWRSLGETGLEPARLCLEITESVLMEDLEVSVEALLGLKALGVRIAIDDFGTGYSSLSYLRRLPVDFVKIDRSFVAGVGLNPADDAIVASVVNLSHALGLRVVAEGVETRAQLIAVRALGCDQAQGFYWSRPVPLGELDAWTREAGRAAVGPEPVDLSGLLVDRTTALRAATGRPVVLQAPPRLGDAVADLGAVRTVLDHLLGNAVTYSGPERPVVVSAASDRHWVRVSVADFGIGMTPQESDRCFEQFWQARDRAQSGSTGTGIGLSIVRSLVEAMGGHVGVKSAKGKGSTFTFALPRSVRAAARPARGLAPDVGEYSTIRETMRQIGVPTRRGS